LIILFPEGPLAKVRSCVSESLKSKGGLEIIWESNLRINRIGLDIETTRDSDPGDDVKDAKYGHVSNPVDSLHVESFPIKKHGKRSLAR